MEDLEENYLACIISKELYDICIGTGYQPPRRPALPAENIQQILRRDIPGLFIGDLNARHMMLCHRNYNTNRRTITQQINAGIAKHIPTDFNTCFSPAGHGTPDIILTNNNNFFNMETAAGPITTSDHKPKIVKLSTESIAIPSSPRYSYKTQIGNSFGTI